MEAMVEVAVLYDDLTLSRVPWRLKESLRLDGVLSIAVLHPDRPNLRKRGQALCELDYYLLVWDDEWCYLTGYDDNLNWFSLTHPWPPNGMVHRFPYVVPETSLLFEGKMVEDDVYQKAKDIFNDRNGEMF